MNGGGEIKAFQTRRKNLFGGGQESRDEAWEYFPRSWPELQRKRERKDHIPLLPLWKLLD